MLDCEAIIRKSIGDREMTPDEVNAFFEQAKNLKAKTDAELKANGMLPDVDKLAREYAKREEFAALVKKRNTQLQIQKRFAVYDFCMTNFKGMEAEGIQALQAGSRYLRDGSRLSVGEAADALGKSYQAQIVVELGGQKGTLWRLLASRKMDREIAEALFSIDTKEKFTGPKEAMQIAEVIHKAQERARTDANRSGAWIASLPGYIVRQSHDPAKISKAGFEAWRDYALPRIDWKKTADGAFDPKNYDKAMDDFMYSTWDALASGIHLKNDLPTKNPLASPSTMGSKAAQMSHERVLHFKSGGDWFDYNARFGRGPLGAAIMQGLQSMANGTALMRTFGPAPDATINWVMEKMISTFKKRRDIAGEKRLENMRTKISQNMRLLDGSANMDGNITAAQVGRYLRAWQSMSRLGGALISSITDVPNIGFEFMYQGGGFFKSMAQNIAYFMQGRPTLEQQRIAAECGVFFDSILGGIAARVSDDALQGKAAAFMNWFFKINGLSFWTDNWKKAAVLTMSNHLANLRQSGWDALNPQYRRLFSQYGIDAERWNLIRKSSAVLSDGRDYLTPEGIMDLPNGEFAAWLSSKGKPSHDAAALLAKTELADQLRTLFRDRVHYAVLEPDVANRRLMYQGTSAGTWLGEPLRYVMQFKSFPTSFVQRTMAREIFGRGARGMETVRQVFGKPSEYGDRSNFMTMFCAMTALGVCAMNMKAIAAGKSPRELFDKDMWHKTLFAGMLQGGGLGILGDFFFGDYSRMGTGPIASSLGPMAGNVDALGRIGSRIRQGDIDVLPESLRLAASNTPGNNLFWAKWALDYWGLHQLNEWLRPGYINRMKQRLKRENGQTFWLDPAKAKW